MVARRCGIIVRRRAHANMDQRELKELEKRCIQEEAPVCTARCPIHVDVRKFLKKAASGLWDEAFQTLAERMPFPGIVGRICDHPCEVVCKRAEAGDAIRISDLERTTVARGRKTKRQIPLPQKTYRVAVVQGGLSSLTVAWDLILKGYHVSILEAKDRLGGRLWEISPQALPSEIIEEETDTLEKMGVEVRLSERMNERGRFEALFDEFDAVYLGLDSEVDIGLSVMPGDIPTHPFTLATSRPGFFVGGKDKEEAVFSPIQAIADGRRAATSIDRYLQKVSLTAGREKEGPYETRLFTSLKGVAPEHCIPMKDPKLGYDETEAGLEAQRCLQCECMECVKVCAYLERFKSYPKRYIRQIYNNETILIGSHGDTNRLINSCSLCGLCAVVCPSDLSMAPVCMEGRVKLVKKNKMPPSAHDFALEDMLSSNSEKSALAFHEPGKDRSTFVFFPGCQLGAMNPDHVTASYAYLCQHLEGGVGLMIRCCGAPAKWAGHSEFFLESLTQLVGNWEKLGRPSVITACPTCYQVLKECIPHIEITTLWHVLAESMEEDNRDWTAVETLAVHDPCTTRHEPGIRNSVRRILTRMGCSIEELSLSGATTECCGFGGLISASNPSLAREVARRRASRSESDYVTYCAMCCNSLAASGKRVLHVLDLVFGKGGAGRTSQKIPGLSERQENRYRLQQSLLKELWGDQERAMDDYEKITLHMTSDVKEMMEDRRILMEDVRKVIDCAEKSGVKFFNPDLGHWLASFKPAHVTYWVEYSREGEGFRVHNAYYHRMEVVGSGKK